MKTDTDHDYKQLSYDDRQTIAIGLQGNPPKNPSVVKVEISMKEFLHEKEQVHR
jgi:hypothetical protein